VPDRTVTRTSGATVGGSRKSGRLYRFHWREQRGKHKLVRWREERLRPADARCAAADLATAATGGAVRIALIGADGRTDRCVVTNAHAIAAWKPGRALPNAAGSDWTAENTRRNARVRTFGRLKSLLWDAKANGLLDLRDAASIAHAVSLALDGAGPFTTFGE